MAIVTISRWWPLWSGIVVSGDFAIRILKTLKTLKILKMVHLQTRTPLATLEIWWICWFMHLELTFISVLSSSVHLLEISICTDQVISNLIPFRNLNLMFALGIVVRTLVTLLSTTAAGANDHHEQPLWGHDTIMASRASEHLDPIDGDAGLPPRYKPCCTRKLPSQVFITGSINKSSSAMSTYHQPCRLIINIQHFVDLSFLFLILAFLGFRVAAMQTPPK